VKRLLTVLLLCVVGIAMVVIFTAGSRPATTLSASTSPARVSAEQPSADRDVGQSVEAFGRWMAMEAQQTAATARAIASATPPAVSPAPIVTPPPSSSPVTVEGSSGDDYSVAQWQLVSNCENAGSWIPQGPAYPDGVGLDATNWAQFGGGSDTSPGTTAAVGNAFLAYYGMAIPDQDGCGGGY
jgi:hypothetical protein